MISAQSKDLFYGLYGDTPVPVDPEIQKKALKGYPRGETPITCRPADVIEPEMEKNKKDVEGLAKDIDDVLIYAIYPMTGKRFLKWKYGLEPIPDEVKPKTLEDCAREAELVRKAKAGLLVEKPQKAAPEKGPGIRTFNVFVDGDYFEVEVEAVGEAPVITSITKVDGGFKVTWNAVDSADSYQVFRATDPYGTYTLIGTTTNLLFSDLTELPMAFYYVKAVRN